ncbi:MAG: FecR domain-containing protein [Burkholderiales bacterium]|nr:FecR domain-containing protein [Burkholderiales bacterium]
MRIPFVATLCVAATAMGALAAPSTVTAVNMPAWIEHNAQMRPLAPGMRLDSHDIIRTGHGARVLISLPEGSQVKLGEDAVFRLENLNVSDGSKTPFTATLDVIKGAFRFTTALLAKQRQREVAIHVATITAGIRGTDIWGKSDNERDLVCLLEGKISVAHAGESALTMDEPDSFFVVPKDQPAQPVAKVDPAKVAQEWAPQTEPMPGHGLAMAGSHHRLTVATVNSQAEALNWYDTLRSAGYDAKLHPVGRGRFEIRIEMLASEQDAAALGAQLHEVMKTPESRVSP